MIRQILEDHGIQDKDKLDHIPNAIRNYMREQMMELASTIAVELQVGTVEIRKSLEFDGF